MRKKRTYRLKNFSYASKTHKGLVRKHNEDFLAYFDTLNGHVFVLCDGMGGHSAGDVAAEMAAEAVGKYCNAKYHANPFETIEKAMIFANKQVCRHALGNNYLNGMGSTIVVALIRNDRVFYGHAGDSRLYVCKQKKLQQLTKDHSYIQNLLDKGIITENDADYHPRRNEITRAVGLSYEFTPEVSSQAFIPHNGDQLLLCSDGLTNMVSEDEIAEILNSPHKINEKAAKLVKKAKSYGGIDNISVQIVKFHNLLKHEETENSFKKTSKILKHRKIIYSVALTISLLVLAFFAGIHDNGKEIIRKQNYNFRDNNFQPTEIIAYTPNENDTWQDLAYKFNVEEKKLKKLNPNVNNFDTKTHVKIPIQSTLVVTQFVDIKLLSKQFNINIIDIMKANDINSIYLTLGEQIIIPLNSQKLKK